MDTGLKMKQLGEKKNHSLSLINVDYEFKDPSEAREELSKERVLKAKLEERNRIIADLRPNGFFRSSDEINCLFKLFGLKSGEIQQTGRNY